MKDIRIVIICEDSTVFTPGPLADLVRSPHLALNAHMQCLPQATRSRTTVQP